MILLYGYVNLDPIRTCVRACDDVINAHPSVETRGAAGEARHVHNNRLSRANALALRVPREAVSSRSWSHMQVLDRNNL